MLTLKLLRDDPEYVVRKLAVKHFDARDIVYKIIELDKTRRTLQAELDSCLAEQKQKAALMNWSPCWSFFRISLVIWCRKERIRMTM